MTIRPILFSGPMVRALLDGRKTQTRRILKLRSGLEEKKFTGELVNYYGDHRLGMTFEGTTLVQPVGFAPGDMLYVRESWAARLDEDHIKASKLARSNAFFWADGPGYCCNTGCAGAAGRVRAAMHLPRRMSRLTLEVTDVRVQRLHDISDADAKAEGIQEKEGFVVRDGKQVPGHGYFSDEENCLEGTPFWAFRRLWESINGKGAWDENPYVAAITFKVHRCNVDKITP